MRSSMQKIFLYFSVILVGLIVIKLTVFSDSQSQAINEELVVQTEVSSETVNRPSTKINTIASAWQWERNDVNEGSSQTPASVSANQENQAMISQKFPFTQETVYQALHAVKLDENGDLILDDDALNALNATLEQSQLKLDDEALTELQSLIRKGLPGHAGEQAAQIVADYYKYLGAKSEFNSLYETTNGPDQNIENYETQYNELLALQELYLGSDVAKQLFATSNANAQYMFESMKLEANPTLSTDEKEQAQAKIVEHHAEATTNVNNWNERYQAFLSDKKFIINSSIGEDEKRDQLIELMHEHFSHEELAYVSHLQLDSLE